MNGIIVDANVVAKTLIDEIDSAQALALLRTCVTTKIPLSAPELLKYELVQVGLKKQLDLQQLINLLENSIITLITLQAPSQIIWHKAGEIAQQGHVKSGYPSIYDSIYHAMAIVNNGLFVTADKRHYQKAQHFGHIALLADWQTFWKTL